MGRRVAVRDEGPALHEHLVDVLLLLRQPSLSAQLSTFNDVYEYLKRALPPLPEEITSTTTEAFDRIDSLRQQDRQLQRQAAAAERILVEDLALARARARRRALDAVEAERETRARQEAVEYRQRSLGNAKENLAKAEADHGATLVELRVAEEVLAELRTSAQAQEAETLGQLLAQAESEAASRPGHARPEEERRSRATDGPRGSRSGPVRARG